MQDLDAKYGLTNNLTLDVTINTDFAQVEADDQQINLTRFSYSFQRKEPSSRSVQVYSTSDLKGKATYFTAVR